MLILHMNKTWAVWEYDLQESSKTYFTQTENEQ